MSIECLGYIGLNVSNLEAWRHFGTAVLGMMAVEDAHGGLRFRYDDQAWRVALHEGSEDDISYAGFEVAGPEELSAVRSRLEQAGITIEEGTNAHCEARGVLGLFSCRDPQGLVIEVFFGPSMATETPFVSPTGVSRFITGEQGMGHIFLQAQDIEAMRTFYRSALGFSLTDIIEITPAPDVKVDLEFYHCNPRHHTIGMAPAMGEKKLHHFMLQTASINDLGFAYDRACAAPEEVTATIGCHTNDQVVSFYVRTPSDFDVEFGFGGLTIHDAWRTTKHYKPSSWGHKGLAGN